MTQKEVYKKFFELKAKQMIAQLYLALRQQLGYTQDQVDLMMKVMKVKDKLDTVEKEMYELIMANQEYFEKPEDVQAASADPEYKVSVEKQRELAEEMVGMKLSLEELYDKLS